MRSKFHRTIVSDKTGCVSVRNRNHWFWTLGETQRRGLMRKVDSRNTSQVPRNVNVALAMEVFKKVRFFILTLHEDTCIRFSRFRCQEHLNGWCLFWFCSCKHRRCGEIRFSWKPSSPSIGLTHPIKHLSSTAFWRIEEAHCVFLKTKNKSVKIDEIN